MSSSCDQYRSCNRHRVGGEPMSICTMKLLLLTVLADGPGGDDDDDDIVGVVAGRGVATVVILLDVLKTTPMMTAVTSLVSGTGCSGSCLEWKTEGGQKTHFQQ